MARKARCNEYPSVILNEDGANFPVRAEGSAVDFAQNLKLNFECASFAPRLSALAWGVVSGDWQLVTGD
jgi:hypothetical protein